MTNAVSTYGFGDAEALASALEPWRGGRARVLEYTASHKTLSIWITKPDGGWIIGDPSDGGVLLHCAVCIRVAFDDAWGPIHFDVSGPARAENDALLEIRDSDRFHVKCWDAQVTGVFRDWFHYVEWEQQSSRG